MSAIGDWAYMVLGLSAAGPWYGFWSGFGADISELSLLALPVVYLRHHRCHADQCRRLGHSHEGVVVCRRHRVSPYTAAPPPANGA